MLKIPTKSGKSPAATTSTSTGAKPPTMRLNSPGMPVDDGSSEDFQGLELIGHN